MVIRCFGDDFAGFVDDDFHAPPPMQRPVSAAAMLRKLSNLVQAPAFQPIDMGHIARPFAYQPA